MLATLRVEGAPYRMSPKALLDALILTSGGLSNLLRKLEKAGQIRRLADDTDGRGVIVELTELGRRSSSPPCAIMLKPSKGCRGHPSKEEQSASSCSGICTDDAQIDSGSTWLPTRATESRAVLEAPRRPVTVPATA